MTPRLYRIYDDKDVLLYVGVSLNFINRVMYHQCFHHNDWSDLAAKITLEKFPNHEDALGAEELAIEREKPLFNMYPTNGHKRRIAKALKVREIELVL